jgi:uncharacterized tellurite resistance protein B-like protein
MFEKIMAYITNPLRGKEDGDRPLPRDARTLNMALLMIDIAGSDQNLAPEELQLIREILAQEFSLNPDESELLLQEARSALGDQTDLWEPISRLNQELNVSEKRDLLYQLWRIVFADGRLDGHEDHLIHKIADLLKLEHEDLIRAKISARSPA